MLPKHKEQELRGRIVETAKSFIGTPYSWKDPEKGINCAALVGEVLCVVCPKFAEYWEGCNRGLNLAFQSGEAPSSHGAGSGWGSFLTKTSEAWGVLQPAGSNPKPGDWVLLWETDPKQRCHVGIFCGKTLVSSQARGGVYEEPWTDAMAARTTEVYSWRGLHG